MIQGVVRKFWLDKNGRKHISNTSVSQQVVNLNSTTHVRYLDRKKE